MRIYLQLLGQKRFAALCFGQAVSLLGDALFPIIIVVSAAQAGTPAETIGAAFAARFLALGGVVLFSGALLDRINPVIAAVGADATRVLALIGLALFWDGNLDAVVLAVAIVVGLCEAVSEPALLVIAPRVVAAPHPGSAADEEAAESRITAVYGLLEGMRNTSGIAGPTLAAALVSLISPSAGAVAAALAFGLSACATRWAGGRYAASHSSTPKADTAPGKSDEQHQSDESDEEKRQEPLLRSALGGLAVLWRVQWLRNVQVLAVVHVLFAVGPWMVALPVLLIERGHSAGVYAFVLGSFAVGTVVGAFLGGRVRGRRRGLYALGLLGLFGLTVLAPVVTDSVLLLMAAFVVGGVGQQAFDVVKMAGLRREVPERLHGRAFSADFFFSFASLPLGQLLGAALLRFLAVETIMLWGGVLVLVTTALAMLSQDTRRFASGAIPAADDRSDGHGERKQPEDSAETISAERAQDVRTR
ncbi:MFS transporter [uncultured Streptomyces sp.]|uniref:MFS transporter n=1 Tax=uncultured Streptomyces sp. TaxID=174707 RepID=UPI0026174013|nr:MFS transporter [uncultured Streptomyces sp.]